MNFFHRLLCLGRNLVRKQQFERQLSDELTANLDLLIEEKVRAGFSLASARREALLEFGGVEQVKEQVRRACGGYQIESLARDFRYAARSLIRSPVFSVVAMLALGVGGGAAIIVFAIADAALGQPLNFTRPQELLQIREHSVEQGLREADVSFPKFTSLKTEGIFHDSEAYTGETATVRTPKGIVQVPCARVTDAFFALLGVQPERGRLLGPGEESDSVLITHRCWQNRFDQDEAVVGQQIVINGKPATVIGVLPADLSKPISEFEVILPNVERIGFFTPDHIGRGAGYLHVLVRCEADQMSLVQTALRRVDERYQHTFPENMDARFTSTAFDLTAFVTRDARPFLYALAAAVGCLFVLACLNVTCLFMTRLAAHRPELALRAALGAERRRLLQHLFSEVLIVTGGGFVLALTAFAVGVYTLGALDSSLLPNPMTASTALRLPAFAGFLFGLTSILLTAAAALYSKRSQTSRGLNPQCAQNLRANRLPARFVVVQIALSLVLLLAAGLFLSALRRVHDVKLGFDPDGVISAKLSLQPSRYRSSSEYDTFVDKLTDGLEKLPGIEHAAIVYGLPLAHDDTYILTTPLAKKTLAVRDRPTTYFRVISPGYFEAMRIPLLKGRKFTSDDTAESPNVVIISEAAARLLFGQADPVGQKLICGGTVQEIHEVVGVAGDVRSSEVARPGREEMYFPIYQQNEPTARLIVRTASTRGTAPVSAAVINRCLQTLDPEQPALEFETMNQLVAKSIASRRLLAFVLAILASLALILAMVGTYGVMSFVVIERRREIGLRLALGASRGDILRLVLARGIKLIVSGVLIGAAFALAVSWYFSESLIEVIPADPMTLLGSSLLLVTLTLAAICLPARRAIRIDPIVALRV